VDYLFCELLRCFDSTVEEHVVDLMRFLFDRDLLRLAPDPGCLGSRTPRWDLSTAREVTGWQPG
jgi:hypothetical protein